MKKPQNSGRLPSFQFYPADWRKDPGVQSLDFETRGIWFEMLCLMHESEERGVLLLNGLPMPESALCRLLGLDNQNLTTAITTLLTYGVAHRREEDGAIYNRRMVKDEALRIIRKNAGSLGGNPVLLNRKSTTPVKQIPTPSSSSSSSISSSSSEDIPPKSPKGEWSPDDPQVRVASWFNRRPSTQWSDKELRAWSKLDRSEESLSLLESYYRAEIAPEADFRRKDLFTLLNNWNGEMDRARRFVPAPVKAQGPDWLPENWREIAVKIAGPKVHGFKSHTELSSTDQMKLYQICKGELNLDEEDAA